MPVLPGISEFCSLDADVAFLPPVYQNKLMVLHNKLSSVCLCAFSVAAQSEILWQIICVIQLLDLTFSGVS